MISQTPTEGEIYAAYFSAYYLTRREKENQKYSKKSLKLYIDKWIDGTVTLWDWVQHKHLSIVDIGEAIDDRSVAVKKKVPSQERIQFDRTLRVNQEKLFGQLIEIFTKYFWIIPFQKLPPNNQIKQADFHKQLLSKALTGDVNEVQKSLLKNQFLLLNWDRLHEHYSYWLSPPVSSTQIDIHCPPCLLEVASVMKYLDFLKKFQSGEEESKNIEQQENNPLLSAIEKNLSDFKNEFVNPADYQKAIIAVEKFFLGTPQTITVPVSVRSGNIKNIAFALGEIWRSQNPNEVITFEYLQFYKKTFSIFKNQKIEKSHLFGCNLYKYSITKT